MDSQQEGGRPGSPELNIRRKLALAFVAVACFVAVFVIVVIGIYESAIERAALIEAEHVSELIASSAIDIGLDNPVFLQHYITDLNALRKRGVVILDLNRKGIANANPGEVGQLFAHDHGNEVVKTLNDGQPRTFIETNDLHPEGAHQVVVAMRQHRTGSTGPIIGAIVLEYTQIRAGLFDAERDQLYLIVALGAAVVLVVTVLGLALAKRISGPLQDLKIAVDRIAMGAYETRVPQISRDEIGRLGLAINKMAADLAVSRAALVAHDQILRVRIADRTEELSKANVQLTEEARERAVAADRIDYLATYDELTGLPNRNLFHERLQQCMTIAREHGHRLGLVIFDVERFRAINDTLGERAGDAVLREIAARMSASTEHGYRQARVGPDHFAVFVPELKTDEQLARIVEQRFALLFDSQFLIRDSNLSISAKAGIAIFPIDGRNVESLFKNAEAALRDAKASGDRYKFYTSGMNARVASRLKLENQLREALVREEFVLHYQPKINLASGLLTGAEALIRWNNPATGRMVPPNEFIPILEETGMIHDVGRWAKRQAIEHYLRWRDAGLPVVRISVNVSPVQLHNRDFIGDVAHTIGVDADAAAGLELEITEGVFIRDIDRNIASLQAIRAMGVTIAIDDFGTGFSSLSYLARLPVDRLKIDRSFVNDMTAGPEGLALVSTIISLAHSLKMKVVAEGVETEEQSRLLQLLGCDEMQGYLLSRAVPSDVFETRFLRHFEPGTVIDVDKCATDEVRPG